MREKSRGIALSQVCILIALVEYISITYFIKYRNINEQQDTGKSYKMFLKQQYISILPKCMISKMLMDIYFEKIRY